MASFLFLVIGVVIGFVGGWFLRGLRTADTKPAPTAKRADQPVKKPATTVAEPAIDSASPTERIPAATPPVSAADPAAATQQITADPEPAAATQPIAVADPEPAAATQPITALDPEPAAATQPITVVDEEPAAATQLINPAEPAAATQPITVPDAEPTAAAETPAGLEPVAEPVAVEPAPPAAVRVGADDLTKIAGIGPKIAAALAAAGITTYRELADTDVATLRNAITAARLRLAPSLATWPQQAKLLAER